MGDAGCVLGMAVIRIGVRMRSQGRAMDVSLGRGSGQLAPSRPWTQGAWLCLCCVTLDSLLSCYKIHLKKNIYQVDIIQHTLGVWRLIEVMDVNVSPSWHINSERHQLLVTAGWTDWSLADQRERRGFTWVSVRLRGSLTGALWSVMGVASRG